MKELRKQMQKQFDRMTATGKLFRVNLSGEDINRCSNIIFRDNDTFITFKSKYN